MLDALDPKLLVEAGTVILELRANLDQFVEVDVVLKCLSLIVRLVKGER